MGIKDWKIVSEEHIEKFSALLTEVMKSEVALGNKVVETSAGWPEPRTIMIFLQKPFLKKYDTGYLEFREVNDPHYWHSEYYDKSTGHILACKFE
jgi:hypothetical protein